MDRMETTSGRSPRPGPIARAGAYADRAFRRLTVSFRDLPQVLAIGAPRSGTTSLARWMASSPSMAAPSRKEIQFFDIHFDRGLSWYRAFFPIGGRKRGFDASPSYMASPVAAARAKATVPNAKIVSVLRDPTDRAWSHYRHRRSVGTETRDPWDAFEEQLSGPKLSHVDADRVADIPILTAGLYAEQLGVWIDEFGAGNVMILESEEVFSTPSTLQELVGFLDIDPPPWRMPISNSAPPANPPPELAEAIREYYDEPNRDLFELVGREFSWS